MKSRLAALPWLLIGVGASAAMRYDSPPPDPTWNLAQVAEWARQADYMAGNMVPERPGDVNSGLGTVFDRNCFEGLSGQVRAAKIHEMKKTVAYTLTQIQRCYNVTRIETLPGILSNLRRTRISCTGVTRENAGLETPQADWAGNIAGGETPIIVNGWTPISGGATSAIDVRSRAALLAHELMHVGKCNNRHWHADVLSGKYQIQCNEPSLYLDRIYFLQGVCFPGTGLSGSVYREIEQCPNVCHRAFTEVDDDATSWWTNFRSGGVAGEAFTARRYGPKEAQLVCDRIVGQARLFRLRDRERDDSVRDLTSMQQYIADHLDASEAGRFKVAFTYIKSAIKNAYDPNKDLTLQRQEVDARKLQLERIVRELCVPTVTGRTRSFCLVVNQPPDGGPIFSNISRIQSRLNAIRPNDLALRAMPGPNL